MQTAEAGESEVQPQIMLSYEASLIIAEICMKALARAERQQEAREKREGA